MADAGEGQQGHRSPQETGSAGATDAGRSGTDVGVSVNRGADQLVPIGEVRALQGTNDRLRNDISGLQRQLGEANEAVTAARQQAEAAQQTALGTLRRALLAEHRGRVVEELVEGTTAEELEASLERARAAYGRIAEATRRQLAEQRVPAGTPTRTRDLTPEQLAALSATEKIARGLAERTE
jgi:hypothetical protein